MERVLQKLRRAFFLGVQDVRNCWSCGKVVILIQMSINFA